MKLHEVILKLPDVTLTALRQIARDEDVSVGALVRDAIERDLKRREQAKTPVRADERLVAPLRALLAHDFAYAVSWEDLLTRLSAKGYALAEAGGGLVLTDLSGHRLCKGSELGYGYAALLRKFDAPFPGHRHDWLLARLQKERRPGECGPGLIENQVLRHWTPPPPGHTLPVPCPSSSPTPPPAACSWTATPSRNNRRAPARETTSLPSSTASASSRSTASPRWNVPTT